MSFLQPQHSVIELGVNIDHVATLRNARGTIYPDPVQAALLAEQAELQEKIDAANAWELAANDPANPPQLPAGVTPAQLAGWTTVSRVLLNLDEAITKE